MSRVDATGRYRCLTRDFKLHPKDPKQFMGHRTATYISTIIQVMHFVFISMEICKCVDGVGSKAFLSRSITRKFIRRLNHDAAGSNNTIRGSLNLMMSTSWGGRRAYGHHSIDGRHKANLKAQPFNCGKTTVPKVRGAWELNAICATGRVGSVFTCRGSSTVRKRRTRVCSGHSPVTQRSRSHRAYS